MKTFGLFMLLFVCSILFCYATLGFSDEANFIIGLQTAWCMYKLIKEEAK